MNSLVAIVGPTGVGKSRLALSLARAFRGEIVNADSRQIYRYLDIGTAKPTPEELSLVPYHLIDIINPDKDFSLAQYQKLAYQAIDNIQRRNILPFLVGGSGLYIRAVMEGWQVPEVPPDTGFRQALEEKAAEIGAAGLFQELLEVDPAAAEKHRRLAKPADCIAAQSPEAGPSCQAIPRIPAASRMLAPPWAGNYVRRPLVSFASPKFFRWTVTRGDAILTRSPGQRALPDTPGDPRKSGKTGHRLTN